MLLDAYLHFLKAKLLKFLSNEVSRLQDTFLNSLIFPCSWSEATLTVLLYLLPFCCINILKGSFTVSQNKSAVFRD